MLSIFKRSNKTSERQLRKYRKVVDQINKLESTYEEMSDEQLTSMTEIFKERVQSGENIKSIIPDAFAVVREASKRVLNMRPFDVQLIGGIVLNRRRYCRNANG